MHQQLVKDEELTGAPPSDGFQSRSIFKAVKLVKDITIEHQQVIMFCHFDDDVTLLSETFAGGRSYFVTVWDRTTY
jgi:hypothetical protein